MTRINNFLDTVHKFASSNIFRRLILIVFIVQSVFLVFVTQIGVPPDENNHINFAKYYAAHSITPTLTDQKPTWTTDDLTRTDDYLYAYVNSFVMRLIASDTAQIYIIRLTSVLVALLAFIFTIKVFQILKISDAIINTGLAIITNLPMVLMLSSAVNNDVGIWLATSLCTWLLFKTWRSPSLTLLAYIGSVSTFASLYKRTFMPIALVVSIIAICFVIKKWSTFRKSIDFKNISVILSLLILIVGSGLFIERVGINYAVYGSISPSCERVQGKEACSVHWSSKRQRWLDAGAPADENIWLPADAHKDSSPESIITFLPKWIGTSLYNIVDIQTQGWRHTAGPPVWLVTVLGVVFGAPLIVGIIYDLQKFKSTVWARRRLLVVALGLTVIVAQLAYNYNLYLKDLVFGLALNGRYILPSIILLFGLSGYYLAKAFGKRTNIIIGALLVIITIGFSGLYMMVRNPQLFIG